VPLNAKIEKKTVCASGIGATRGWQLFAVLCALGSAEQGLFDQADPFRPLGAVAFACPWQEKPIAYTWICMCPWALPMG